MATENQLKARSKTGKKTGPKNVISMVEKRLINFDLHDRQVMSLHNGGTLKLRTCDLCGVDINLMNFNRHYQCCEQKTAEERVEYYFKFRRRSAPSKIVPKRLK